MFLSERCRGSAKGCRRGAVCFGLFQLFSFVLANTKRVVFLISFILSRKKVRFVQTCCQTCKLGAQVRLCTRTKTNAPRADHFFVFTRGRLVLRSLLPGSMGQARKSVHQPTGPRCHRKSVAHARSHKSKSCSVWIVDMYCKLSITCFVAIMVPCYWCSPADVRRTPSDLSFRIRSKAPLSALVTVSIVVARCLEATTPPEDTFGQQHRWEPRR